MKKFLCICLALTLLYAGCSNGTYDEPDISAETAPEQQESQTLNIQFVAGADGQLFVAYHDHKTIVIGLYDPDTDTVTNEYTLPYELPNDYDPVFIRYVDYLNACIVVTPTEQDNVLAYYRFAKDMELIDQHSLVYPENLAYVYTAQSQDGKHIFYVDNATIYRANADGTQVTALYTDEQCPDEQRIQVKEEYDGYLLFSQYTKDGKHSYPTAVGTINLTTGQVFAPVKSSGIGSMLLSGGNVLTYPVDGPFTDSYVAILNLTTGKTNEITTPALAGSLHSIVCATRDGRYVCLWDFEAGNELLRIYDTTAKKIAIVSLNDCQDYQDYLLDPSGSAIYYYKTVETSKVSISSMEIDWSATVSF